MGALQPFLLVLEARIARPCAFQIVLDVEVQPPGPSTSLDLVAIHER